MNSINLVGRLTRDPELRYTETSKKACVRISLAVDRGISKEDKDNGKKSADFIPLVFWDSQAEVLNKYCKKGQLISVTGRLIDGKYEKNDGTTGYTLEVHVNRLELLGSKNSDNRPEPEYTGYEKPLEEKTNSEIIAEVVNGTNDPFQDFANEIQLSPDDLPF